MTGLPTGTLTLLFSDIEGSTALLHRLGPRWGDALSAQRAILREAFAAHDGTEMGTEGDSFFVVFRSALDAVGAAIAGQQGLARQSWPEGVTLRVRMGIHTGEPQPHEDGYIGEDVHRAARIGSTANGGQIVISGSTRRLIGALPGYVIRDLGRHRLKDLADSENLFDVVGPGLLADFPPLRSSGRSALPAPATPLVGREAALGEIKGLLGDPTVRLVTLTGPGGSGKTRLGLAAGAALDSSFPDGVYFVGLHTADRADVMWSTIDEVLGAEPAPSTPATADDSPDGPRDRVTRYLAGRRALLLLDNLEQIADADAVVSSLLAGAPQVTVLASSRRPLMLMGEREFPVPPLTVPSSFDPADVMASTAVWMFVGRAKMVRPSFELTDSNRDAVATLCRRLDGLPLALELAAAHARVLSPASLLSRLDGKLGAGVTASDRPDRQRTLGATIAWSYDLLERRDQDVFRRLGVFSGPADLDAAQAVAGDDDDDLLDVVNRLVATSLVRVEDGADAEPRLALLETIRTFARERLARSGEADLVAMRHLTWCAAVVARTTAMLHGTLHTVALDRLGAVENDVRAALDFAFRAPGVDGAAGVDGANGANGADVSDDRVAAGFALLLDVTAYWYRFGRVGETRHWQERALAVADEDGGVSTIGLVHGLGMSLLQQGDVDASTSLFERCLALAEALDDRDAQARALNALAIGRRQKSEFAQSLALLHRSLALSRQTGNTHYQALALGNLVVVHIELGEFAQAARVAEESIRVNAANGDDWGVAVDRLNYTAAILKIDGARSAHERYLEWAGDILTFRDQELDLDLIELGAAIMSGLHEPQLTARLLGGADALRSRIPLPRSAADEALVADWLSPARRELSDAEWSAAYDAGQDVTPAQAVELVRGVDPHGPRPL